MDTDDVKAAAAAKVAAAKATVAEAASHPAEVWEVRGPEGGRRRAGLRFTAVPLRVDTRDLTPRDVAAIAGDPLLSVRVLAAEAAEPPKA